jgi:hypothetical protein
MKANHVLIAALHTYEQMAAAIQLIEDDYQNVLGGLRAWTSGHETHLTVAAEKKIASIRRKMENLNCED